MRSDKTPLEHACLASAERLGTFDARELAAAAEVGYETATTWIRRWRRSGQIEELGKGAAGTQRYRLIGIEPPGVATARRIAATPQGNMWRTIRKLRHGFKPTDIAAQSCTPEAPVSQADATAYCQMLTRADYLRVVRKAQPGVREAVYRLARDTGPKPPRERRLRVVWDDNEGRITHLPGGEA